MPSILLPCQVNNEPNMSFMKTVLTFLLLVILCTLTLSAEENLLNSQKQQEPPLDQKKDILLVIHYNCPFYSSVDFIRDLYSPVFANIVFYGDAKSEKESENKDVTFIPSQNGAFFLKVVADVLERYPNYRGYIFLQDDCILNYWNITNLNPDKIWYAISYNNDTQKFYADINLKTGVQESSRKWEGWDYGQTFHKVKRAVDKLSEKQLTQLQKNISYDKAVIQLSDMFYLPGIYRKDAAELCNVYNEVFCEVAVPMMLCSLAPMPEWESIDMMWGQDTYFVFYCYPNTVHWVHPIKFSNESFRTRTMNIFNKYKPAQPAVGL